MRNFKSVILMTLLLFVLPVALRAQNQATPPNQGAGNPAVQGGVLRITSPKPGEQLQQNFVTVRFELTNQGASAAGMPNFQVQLDNRDPVSTDSTSYTFTGMTPGAHAINVQLVDANGTPVAGARGQVQFEVMKPAPPGASLVRHRSTIIEAALQSEEPARQPPEDSDQLPSAAGALPLLSVIGFGVLLGGIASAMRTRK